MKTKEERKQRKAERKRKPHFVRHSFGMAFGVIFLGAAIVIPQITMPFNGMLQGFMGDMDIDITEKKTQLSENACGQGYQAKYVPKGQLS